VADLYRNQNPDSLLLALWVVGTIVFAVFVNWTLNARSVLPLAPAAGILAARRLELRWQSFTPGMGWALTAGAALSLIVARADFAYAVADRTAAQSLDARFAGERLWYTSHWGFQYYLEQQGREPFDRTRDRIEEGEWYA